MRFLVILELSDLISKLERDKEVSREAETMVTCCKTWSYADGKKCITTRHFGK